MSKLSSIRELSQTALRQIIWETLNRHNPGPRPDIALVGSRRSGSTLLMQLIAHDQGLKSVNQPFSIYTATSAQMKVLGWPAGGMFVAPTAKERASIKAYLQAMHDGRLHVQEPWRFWRKDFHFRSNRLVLKTTNASYIMEIFAEIGLDVVLYFRHPIPQAMSCARNGWGDMLNAFSRHRTFYEGLDAAQRALLDRLIAGEGEELDRYVLCWCLENRPLFAAHAAGVPTIFYEDLVMQPEKTLETLTRACAITPTAAMRGMLGQASVSVRGLSDKEGASAIKSGDRDALVSRWRSKVDDATVTRVQAILDLFPGCVYTAGDVLPRRGLAEGAPAV